MLMLIFVKVMKGAERRGGGVLGQLISFLIEICKTEITVCDTVGLAPMLKLVRI